MNGYDYGIRPRVMAVGDVAFAEVWEQSGYVANAYGFWPHYGVIANPAFVCMIFENENKGRELFQNHFVRWANDSNNGDAVGLAFVEWNTGGYLMVIYPEIEHLIHRCFPNKQDHDELEIMAFAPSKGKDFPQKSPFFETFKSAAQDNAILLMGGTHEGPFEDLIIRKLKVEFFHEDQIPDNSIVAPFKRGRTEGEYEEHREPILESVPDIFKRRTRKLECYFPITLERLYPSPKYMEYLRRLLNTGYEEWQVKQAACNLVLSQNLLGNTHFQGFETENEGEDTPFLYDALSSYIETPYMPSLPEIKISTLRRQIKLDSIALLRARHITIPKDTRPKRIQALVTKNKLLRCVSSVNNQGLME